MAKSLQSGNIFPNPELTAPVALSDLDPAGAVAGDVVTLVGGLWNHQAPSSGPSAASSAEVLAGVVANRYVSPLTLVGSMGMYTVGTGYQYATVALAQAAHPSATYLVFGTVTETATIGSGLVVVMYGATWNVGTTVQVAINGRLHIDVYGNLYVGNASPCLLNGTDYVYIDGCNRAQVVRLYFNASPSANNYVYVSNVREVTTSAAPWVPEYITWYFDNCQITGNCNFGAGAVYAKNCLFYGNIQTLNCAHTFDNCRISVPSSDGSSAYAMYISSLVTLRNCVIENLRDSAGDAALLAANPSKVQNTLFWTANATGVGLRSNVGMIIESKFYGCILRHGVVNVAYEAGNVSNLVA